MTTNSMGDADRDGASDSGERSLRAIFAEPADPRIYLPREASDRVLERIRNGFDEGVLCAVICGPPGLGKTLLLRVLEARLGGVGRDAIYVPHAALDLPEFCRWTLGLVGRTNALGSVEELRLEVDRSEARGGPLHLLIDDANAMPVETARRLGDLVRACAGGLRLTLASLDDARMSRVAAALDLDATEARYRDPMSIDETRSYLAGRLQWASATKSVRDRLDAETVERLHGLSGGNPRRLNLLAGEAIRGDAGRAILTRIEPGWSDRLLEPRRSSARFVRRDGGAR